MSPRFVGIVSSHSRVGPCLGVFDWFLSCFPFEKISVVVVNLLCSCVNQIAISTRLRSKQPPSISVEGSLPCSVEGCLDEVAYHSSRDSIR